MNGGVGYWAVGWLPGRALRGPSVPKERPPDTQLVYLGCVSLKWHSSCFAKVQSGGMTEDSIKEVIGRIRTTPGL